MKNISKKLNNISKKFQNISKNNVSVLIRAGPESVHGHPENKAVHFYCEAEGDPQLTISWYQNSVKITGLLIILPKIKQIFFLDDDSPYFYIYTGRKTGLFYCLLLRFCYFKKVLNFRIKNSFRIHPVLFLLFLFYKTL